jgi:AraC family transcriptional regulator, regulatory protein of adaptative response / methylated-DNA-[protein]-cysteine methyltransferase
VNFPSEGTLTAKVLLTSETAWRAVVEKDRHYDGKFVYAAVTTGIYCRPSCPARNPQRRNILVLPTVGEAERRGFVACLRCHPKSFAPAESSIKTALEFVEKHVDQTITLRTLSRAAGLSPHYLQEIFTRIVGLSPKDFCDARRVSRFKQQLKGGQSIATACYEAGYGSSRALYERTKVAMGMTPSTYRRGGDGVHIRYAVARIGKSVSLIARTELGPCAVLAGKVDHFLIRELREEFPNAKVRRESPMKWKSAVRSCQVEDPLLTKLPSSLRRRIFQAKVWNAVAARILKAD